MELNIVAVSIDQQRCDVKYRKVLSENYYLFNDRVIVNDDNRIVLNPDYKNNSWYFGKNINVQAIVGPNGSGKSSLLELMYRIINNFSALIERGMKRNAAWKLLFVDKLYAELYYVQDGHLYCISCRGNDVFFLSDDYKEQYFSASTYSYGQSKVNKLMVTEMAQLAERLHYTIVTNYSLQSLVSSDYQDETSLAPDANGVFAPEQEGTVWISHLYHKNDGYLTPIVLNPFRDKLGNIDIVTEHRLTIYRLSALMLFYRNRKGFFDDYKLNDIQYSFSLQTVYEKYQIREINDDQYKSAVLDVEHFVPEHPKSVMSILLSEMGFINIRLGNDIMRASALYLVYKILNIASKYPSYTEFDQWSLRRFDETVSSKDDLMSLGKLVDKVLKDKSHITIKVIQVRNLLEIIRKKGTAPLEKESFSIDEYLSLLDEPVVKGRNKLFNIMYTLPPSFFIPTLTIKNPNKNGDTIDVAKLSSGERQLLYTLSTYVYHIRNLLSIPKDRVAYRHISLILDEAEICFHPEYQRLFVSRLLYMIKSLNLNLHCAYNIILSTHSPFILSDMPRENILYLDGGEALKREDFIRPLAANISDILYQSFFLKNGFIGEWARTRINEILQKNDYWEQLSSDEQRFINEIGDDYVRKQIKRHLGEEEQ